MTHIEKEIFRKYRDFWAEKGLEPNIILLGSMDYDKLLLAIKPHMIKRVEEGNDKYMEYQGMRVIRVYERNKIQIGYIKK